MEQLPLFTVKVIPLRRKDEFGRKLFLVAWVRPNGICFDTLVVTEMNLGTVVSWEEYINA